MLSRARSFQGLPWPQHVAGEERREGSETLPSGLTRDEALSDGGWHSLVHSGLYQHCSEFGILTDLSACSSVAMLHDLPVTVSSAVSLWLLFWGAPHREGTFSLTCHSIHLPRHPLLVETGKKEKIKKKSGFYTNLRKCFKPSSHTCDLWNVTWLFSIIIKKPEVLGETGQKWTLCRLLKRLLKLIRQEARFLFLDCLASVEFCWCYLGQHVRIMFVCPLR